MTTLSFAHDGILRFGSMVTKHHFALRIMPHDDPAQNITIDEVLIHPPTRCTVQVDGFDNLIHIGSCDGPHDKFRYLVRGRARTDVLKGRGSTCNEVLRFASPFTHPGKSLRKLHDTIDPFRSDDPVRIFERAVRLQHLVHKTLDYQPKTTDIKTNAEEALCKKQGVCQDYANIFISLLRLDNIAARYVSGFMEGEGATHAWVEFYDGCTWWGLDPTNNCEAGNHYVALARGRDHADCPVESGIFHGSSLQILDAKVCVRTEEE